LSQNYYSTPDDDFEYEVITPLGPDEEVDMGSVEDGLPEGMDEEEVWRHTDEMIKISLQMEKDYGEDLPKAFRVGQAERDELAERENFAKNGAGEGAEGSPGADRGVTSVTPSDDEPFVTPSDDEPTDLSPASIEQRRAQYIIPDLTQFDLSPKAERAVTSALIVIRDAIPIRVSSILRRRRAVLGQYISNTFKSDDLSELLTQAARVPGLDTATAQHIIYMAGLGRSHRGNLALLERLSQIGRRPNDLPVLRAWKWCSCLFWTVGLNILAAPTSAGKTSNILMQILEWLLNPDLKGTIIFWSGETPEDDVWAKIIGILSSSTFWEVIAAGRSETIPASIYNIQEVFDEICDRLIVLPSSFTLPEVRAAAESLADHEKVLAVVVDYIQHLRVDRKPERSANREAEVGGISADLLELGLALKVPVLAGAQVNRTVNRSNEYVPHLNQLRDSGRIEQDAAVVVGLRNENMSGAEQPDPNTPTTAADDICYSDADEDQLRIARLGAQISVQKEHPEGDWILLEGFILKSRVRGGVGTVIPYAFHPSTGRLEPLEQRLVILGETAARGADAGYTVREKKVTPNYSEMHIAAGGDDDDIPAWLKPKD